MKPRPALLNPPVPRGLGAALALLALTLPLRAADIHWSPTAGTTAWATDGNWLGGTAPANDLTADIAVFDQTSYTSQPSLAAGTRSVAGVIFGDGTTATAATTVSGTIRIGTSGIAKLANSGDATFAGALRLGGSQSWTNNSGTSLTIGTPGTTSTFGTNTDVGPSTLTLDGSGSGQTVINDVIANVNGTLSINISRTGSGHVVFTNANTYSGGTTVSSGVLLVNNTTGSGTGSGAVTAASSGTLGGAGIISGAASAGSGAFLVPGSDSGVAGTLTFSSTLDISGLASGDGGLLFDLGAPAASDQIALTSGALTIGNGVLDLGDFSFTTLSGFGAGTYTLIDGSTSIVGTLGSNLTGVIDGFNVVLSLSDSGRDIILTVSSAIPEPSACAAIFGLLALACALRRGHARSRR